MILTSSNTVVASPKSYGTISFILVIKNLMKEIYAPAEYESFML